MSAERSLKQGLIVAAGLYSLYCQPLSTAVFTLALAGILYFYTRSLEFVLILLVLSLGLGGFTRVLGASEPVGISEGYQDKDPLSIHARLSKEKNAAPLAPKVETVTGVLESPSILDNVPLKAYQELTSDALPGKSIPASAKARVLIYPPAESFVPNMGTQERRVKENPVLQNGPDSDGIESAMLEKGTDMPGADVGAGDLPSVVPGEASAF